MTKKVMFLILCCIFTTAGIFAQAPIRTFGVMKLLEYTPKNEEYVRYITGRIRNDGTKSYSVIATFGLYRNGVKLGETSDTISRLAPGEVWRFKAPIFDDDAKQVTLDSVDYF